MQRTGRRSGVPGQAVLWRAPVLAVGLIAAAGVAAASTSLMPASADAEPVERSAEPPVIESGDEAHLRDDEPPPASPRVDLEAGRNEIQDSSPWAGLWGPEIEPLASYEPQRLCLSGAQPAVRAFATLLERAHPVGRDLGIARDCAVGARSEHKEGRAYDWGVRVTDPAERLAAEQLVAWLLATDEHGNDFAMARRLGVMYVIWDGHIWASSAARDGWRVYRGPSPHTDHVHLSFSWAGATGTTSFWRAARIGPWLFDDVALDRLPSTWDLGGARFRAELGPEPGEPTPWTLPVVGDEREDDAGTSGDGGTDDHADGGTDAAVTSPTADGPLTESAPLPQPGTVLPAPSPTVQPAPLPTVVVPDLTVETTTTTTTTAPVVGDVVDAVEDVGDDLLGG